MPERAPTQKISPLKTTLTPKIFAKITKTQFFLVFFGLNFFNRPFFTPTPWDHQNGCWLKDRALLVTRSERGRSPPFGLKIEYNPYFSRFSPPYYNLLTGKKSPPCWNMIHSRKNSYFFVCFSYFVHPSWPWIFKKKHPFQGGQNPNGCVSAKKGGGWYVSLQKFPNKT